MKTYLVLFCFAFYCARAAQDAPQVEIKQGRLEGKYVEAWNGRQFNSFTGIPFAKPPVGNLRFKAPVPADPWNGTLDATKPHASCPQINIFLNDFNVQGNEDCLYLNVYTPELPTASKQLLPVMYFIHGGGWTSLSANSQIFGPKLLLAEDIVLVSANYRLGTLGFLSTRDHVVPGNNGLKDQNLALKWIKENIAQFGGDPERVTIFGQSAGGVSVHYHVASPLSRDLIKGAIIQSGTTMGLWSLSSKGRSAENNKKLANFLNCPDTSSQEFVDCLMKVDAYDIVKQDTKFLEFSYDPLVPFRPVIEPDLDGAFLTEDVVDIIASGKAADVPLMFGITKDDGAFKAAALYNDSSLISELDKDFNRVAPISLFYDDTYYYDKDAISRCIKDFYFGNHPIDDSTKTEVANMYTDSWIFAGTDASVRLHAKYSKKPVYYYLFAYKGSGTFAKGFGDASHDYGVCHTDDLLYLFNFDWIQPRSAEFDKEMIVAMTKLWTNFATYGDPTPVPDSVLPSKWYPVISQNLEYYCIKAPNQMEMADNLFARRSAFWRTLPLSQKWKKTIDQIFFYY